MRTKIGASNDRHVLFLSRSRRMIVPRRSTAKRVVSEVGDSRTSTDDDVASVLADDAVSAGASRDLPMRFEVSHEKVLSSMR